MKNPLEKLGDAALNSNEVHWVAKYNEALRDARIACEEISKIYTERARRLDLKPQEK